MKIIIISPKQGGTRSFTMGSWTRAVLSLCLVGLPVGAFSLAAHLFSGSTSEILTESARQAWVNDLGQKQDVLEESEKSTEQNIMAFTHRVGELQAQLLKLDALGERLSTLAGMDSEDFDFAAAPALGGPRELTSGDAFYAAPSFQLVLNDLEEDILQRQEQLQVLNTLLEHEQQDAIDFTLRKPIIGGWISSRFGKRIDPQSEKPSWHSGIDVAAPFGTHVQAVADGVVSWVGSKEESHPEYRQFVELSHGGGYKTRYHNTNEFYVRPGDVVKQGQVIAHIENHPVGSHLHFEVYKNGRPVDPSVYFHIARR